MDRLLDYYLHTALAADGNIPAWDTTHRRLPVVRWPAITRRPQTT